MKQFTVLVLISLVAGCATAQYKAWDRVNRGLYPMSPEFLKVSGVVWDSIVTRYHNEMVEFSFCLAGYVQPGGLRGDTLIVTRLHEPSVLRADVGSIMHTACPEGYKADIHSHPGWASCALSLPDKLTFKNSVSWYGYPLLMTAVICTDPSFDQPRLVMFNWRGVREHEDTYGVMKLYTRREWCRKWEGVCDVVPAKLEL
jgi:hypothetical protein